MANLTNGSTSGYVPWSLQNASRDDIIFIFVCAPVSILGFFLCLSSAYVFFSPEFKEKLFTYIRIECILMTINLSITTTRSLAPVYMCRTTIRVCPPQTSLVPVMIDTYVFAYWPSGTEATILTTDIFACLICLLMMSQNRNSIQKFILNLNPLIPILTAYILFSLMFSFQIFSNVFLVHSQFVIKNRIYFDLTAFSIRDGALLMILIVMNVSMGIKMKSSMKKKLSIVSGSSREKTKKSQQRMTKMVFADCINSALGRIPIFSLFVIRNVNRPIITLVPLTSLCSLAVFFSYFLKFFIYIHFNKRFKLLAYKKLPYLKLFYNFDDVNYESSYINASNNGISRNV